MQSHCITPSTAPLSSPSSPSSCAPPVHSPSLAPTSLRLTNWTSLLNMARDKGHISREKVNTLLHHLHNGFPLGVREDIPSPSTVRKSPNLPSARPSLPSHDPTVSLKILESLKQEIILGRTMGPFSSPPFSNMQISPIGAIPKAHSSKLRLIHHLSWPRVSPYDISVNDRLEEAKCEYLHFDTVVKKVAEMGTSCLLSKFDVKDAFRLLRVIPSEQHLLGIHYHNYYFYERCLPFGVHSGPQLFESFSTPIEAIMKAANIKEIFHYADDFLNPSLPERAEREYNLILEIFRVLGVPLSMEKLSPPSPSIEFLGTVIDCKNQIIFIPEDKLIRYKEAIVTAATGSSITIEKLESLVGILRYAARCVQHGSLFIHSLQQSLTSALAASHRSNRHSRHRVLLSQSAKAELAWWKRFITEWNGRRIIPPSLSSFPISSRRCLFTDACNTGMGAWLRKPSQNSHESPQYILHAWTAKELQLSQRLSRISMPYLELRAVILAVYTWRGELEGSAIDLQCDCLPVVTAINKGYSKIPLTHQLLLSLFFITNKHHIFLTCSHLAGEKNVEADALSRAANSNTHQQSVSLSELFFPLPSVSLFYSSHNLTHKEVEEFPSTFCDPEQLS